ncbi:MAG: SRPBCC domain-containing protein [Hyphomonadaceae bacterium]
MNAAAAEIRSIVVERHMPHAPEKVWRALTTSHLIADWLMANDFEPEEGRRFTFRATPVPGWSGVTNCVVLKVDRPHVLSYSWGDGSESDSGLKTVVTWTLTAKSGGTLLRMEHTGFTPQDEGGYRSMSGGWPRIVERLEAAAAKLD